MNQEHPQSETTKKLQQAWDIYRRAGAYNDAQLDEATKVLEGHGLWSLRSMAKITGASYNQIQGRVVKSERTGGRFEPRTLELILEESRLADRGESNPKLTSEIIAGGTSLTFLAKLLGQTPKKIETRLKRLERGDG